MKDRVVQYPSRYKLTPVSGTSDTYDLTAVPGTVTEAGTDLNKSTLLSDAVVSALEAAVGSALTDDTINYALAAIAGVIGTNGLRVVTGQYTGTGTFGSASPTSITLPITPKLLLVYRSNITLVNMSGTAASGWMFVANGVQEVKTGSGTTTSTQYFNEITSWGQTISWFNRQGASDPGTAAYQLNASGTAYNYIAIG